jgi:hypothetical protein
MAALMEDIIQTIRPAREVFLAIGNDRGRAKAERLRRGRNRVGEIGNAGRKEVCFERRNAGGDADPSGRPRVPEGSAGDDCEVFQGM